MPKCLKTYGIRTHIPYGIFRLILFYAICLLQIGIVNAQCCAGGSGSPIGGGSSQGVLQERQIDFNSSFQYAQTNTFFHHDSRDTAFYFDAYSSQYLYSRFAYGLTKSFTLSLEAGYYLNKSQIELHHTDTLASHGIGDLIIFPRYNILDLTTASCRSEITIGLGYKIPLGSYSDSTGVVEPFSGKTYFRTKPPGVQTTSGAQDILFYVFAFRSYPSQNFRIFLNGMYIKKGWNPLGEKMGDYASIGLFAGKTVFGKLGMTLQVKGEWINQMRINENVLLYAYPNYNPDATGSKKVFVVPQLSYLYRNKLTIYALWEYPIYQYMNDTQAGSETQITAGFSYRFLLKKTKTQS